MKRIRSNLLLYIYCPAAIAILHQRQTFILMLSQYKTQSLYDQLNLKILHFFSSAIPMIVTDKFMLALFVSFCH